MPWCGIRKSSLGAFFGEAPNPSESLKNEIFESNAITAYGIARSAGLWRSQRHCRPSEVSAISPSQ